MEKRHPAINRCEPVAGTDFPRAGYKGDQPLKKSFQARPALLEQYL